MKKIVIFMLALLILALPGCKSKPNLLEQDPDVPNFVANPPVSDTHIYGVGSAKFNNNSNESMRAADARARTDLAYWIDSEVQAMLQDYTRIAGTVNNQTTALAFYENVSRQLTSATLRGVEVVQRDRSKDGTYWTLVRISKENAAQISADIIETEASMYAEFKAMEALKLMEQQLNKKK